MKKYFFALVIVIILVGCTDRDSYNNSTKVTLPEEDQSKRITLTYYRSGYGSNNIKKVIDTTIEAYKETHPDVDIQIISSSWHRAYENLVTRLRSNDAPDVMYIPSRWIEYLVKVNALLPLDSYLTVEKINEYYPKILDMNITKDHYYGVPIAMSTKALFYRSDLIKKPPTTWDELIKIAQDVEKQNNGIKGFGVAGEHSNSTLSQLLNYVYQNNGSLMDENGHYIVNSEAVVEALQFYTDLYNKYHIVPNPLEYNREHLSELFFEGKIAMFVSGPWANNYVKYNKGSNEIPYKTIELPRGKTVAGVLVTDSVVISKDTAYPDEAWEFVQYITDIETQKLESDRSQLALYKGQLDLPELNTDYMKPFVNMLEYSQPLPRHPDWNKFSTIMIKAIQKSIMGEMSPRDALNEAQVEIEQLNKDPK